MSKPAVLVCALADAPRADDEIELAGTIEQLRAEVRAAQPNMRRNRN